MAYLQLVNAVLIRLRENTIASGQIDSNPFYRLIGSTINDAKDTIEDAWQWSSLRSTEDVGVAVDESVVELPDSTDNHYHMGDVLHKELGFYLEFKPESWMRKQYANNDSSPVPSGTPRYWAHTEEGLNGEKQLKIYPPNDTTCNLSIHSIKHQDTLTLSSDRLKIPALPVYSLATALASRERGEIGGTPVSELFAIAATHLSDAIAHDTDKFPEETIWYTV